MSEKRTIFEGVNAAMDVVERARENLNAVITEVLPVGSSVTVKGCKTPYSVIGVKPSGTMVVLRNSKNGREYPISLWQIEAVISKVDK